MGFTMGDTYPQRNRDKLHFLELNEGEVNLPLGNDQAADRYDKLAQSVVPSSAIASNDSPADGGNFVQASK